MSAQHAHLNDEHELRGAQMPVRQVLTCNLAAHRSRFVLLISAITAYVTEKQTTRRSVSDQLWLVVRCASQAGTHRRV